MDTVTLLLKSDGTVISVWETRELAEAQAKEFNDDPFIDGDPDVDAPYSVRTWLVIKVVR